jgi:glutamate synthase (NADPH) small chain
MDYGQEEAAALFGADPRTYVTVTKGLVGDAGGNVKELHTVEVEWVKNGDGRLAMKERPGTERVWPAELVLLAMGFVGPEKPGLLAELGVALDPRGNVAVDGEKATSVQGVFAAGDMARGQSLIVWAIQEGRAAARGVDRFLMGETSLP